MSESSSGPIFDSAFIAAIQHLEHMAADLQIDGEVATELPEFDAEELRHRYREVIPSLTEDSTLPDEIATLIRRQHSLITQAPQDLLSQLIQIVPVKALWAFLKHKQFGVLRYQVLRGFQQTPAVLRNQAVRARLVHHFETHHDDFHALLLVWADASPAVLDELKTAPQSSDIHVFVAALIKHHELSVTRLASIYTGNITLYRFLEQQNNNSEALEALLKAAPEEHNVPLSKPTTREVTSPTPTPPSADESLKMQITAQEQTIGAQKGKIQQLEKELFAARTQEKVLTSKWEKKFANTEKKLGDELNELKKHDERQSRRLKATEREREELETENRRLKKQLRHVQQLLEETRKKVAPPTPIPAQTPETPTAPAIIEPTQPARPAWAAPPTPLDEVFEWEADGRRIRVTPREVRRQIDRNDEDGIFAIMLALEALQNRNREQYFKFLHRLKTMDEFYASVLTRPTTRVLVDASNVARSESDKRGRGKMALLFSVREELRRRNCWPILFIADASLPYNLDKPTQFRAMVDSGEIVMAPAGTEADELLTREARKTGAFVVTNDVRFHFKVSPDFEPPRVSFNIYDGTVVLDEF